MKKQPTPQQIAQVVKPYRFNEAINQPKPKKLLCEQRLTKDETFWLRNSLFDGFYGCRPWDIAKRKAIVGIARKNGLNDLVDKFVSDMISEIPVGCNKYKELVEEVRKGV